MRPRIILLAIAVAAASVSLAADGTAKKKLPPPFHTPSATNGPKIISQPQDKKLALPAGFVAEEYASGFKKPRMLLDLPDGTVLVSDAVANGTIEAIKPDKSRKTVLSGLDRPFGLALYKDHLYRISHHGSWTS